MNAPTDWWQTFFSGTSVDMWLQAIPEEQTKLEADFIQKMLQVPPPARPLLVGTKKHSV